MCSDIYRNCLVIFVLWQLLKGLFRGSIWFIMGLRSWIRNLYGAKKDDTAEKKSLMRRVTSSFRRKTNKKGGKAKQSDPQTNGQSSLKSEKSGKKNEESRKRKIEDTETGLNGEEVAQNENIKDKEKIKKAKGNKSSRVVTPTKLNKEEGRGDLDKESEGKENLNDLSHEVERVNDNINNLTISTERVEAINENEAPPVVDEYEEKCSKKITEIMEKSKEFEKQIDTFYDVEKSQAFFYLDENLQRNIEKLDRIDVMDYMQLKEERKNAIKYIYGVLERLEKKAKENEDTRATEVNVV